MNARPHPGPLPQERVNRAPLSDEAETHSGPPSRPKKGKGASIGTVARKHSSVAVALSLSLGCEGERKFRLHLDAAVAFTPLLQKEKDPTDEPAGEDTQQISGCRALARLYTTTVQVPK